MAPPWYHKILVALVVFFVTYLPVSMQALFMSRYAAKPNSLGVILFFTLFDILVVMVWLNYYACINTTAGKVPSDWLPPTILQDTIVEVKVSTQGPRYCRICRGYKPPRAHHCSKCDVCVLKMDHHCPWINNCVGLKNHHYFLRFLFYASVTLSMGFGIVLYIYSIWYRNPYAYWYDVDRRKYQFHLLNCNAILITVLLLGVVPLTLYNFYYASKNYTTIEGLEKEQRGFFYQNGAIWGLENPYDIGFVRNFKSIFGDSILNWMLLQRPSGNGLTFTLRETKLELVGVRIANVKEGEVALLRPSTSSTMSLNSSLQNMNHNFARPHLTNSQVDLLFRDGDDNDIYLKNQYMTQRPQNMAEGGVLPNRTSLGEQAPHQAGSSNNEKWKPPPSSSVDEIGSEFSARNEKNTTSFPQFGNDEPGAGGDHSKAWRLNANDGIGMSAILSNGAATGNDATASGFKSSQQESLVKMRNQLSKATAGNSQHARAADAEELSLWRDMVKRDLMQSPKSKDCQPSASGYLDNGDNGDDELPLLLFIKQNSITKRKLESERLEKMKKKMLDADISESKAAAAAAAAAHNIEDDTKEDDDDLTGLILKENQNEHYGNFIPGQSSEPPLSSDFKLQPTKKSKYSFETSGKNDHDDYEKLADIL